MGKIYLFVSVAFNSLILLQWLSNECQSTGDCEHLLPA